jgi:thiazole/oxazole-forming peptide maturase SagD family component
LQAKRTNGGTRFNREIYIYELVQQSVNTFAEYDELFWHNGHMFCPGLQIRPGGDGGRIVSLLPMPDCATCALSEKQTSTAPQHALLSFAPSLVHWPGGLLKAASAAPLVLRGREGPLWIGKALTAIYPGGELKLGSGRGFTAAAALTGAVGEALEVYCACSDFDAPRAEAKCTGNGPGPEQPQKTTTTSGCAVHTDRRMALETAFREVVERDAFLVSWHTRQVRCHFEISRHPNADTVALAKFLQGAGYKIACAALRTDFPIHVIQAVLWHEDPDIDLPYTVCGLGTGTTAAAATMRGLMEAAQMIPAVANHARSFMNKPEGEWGPEDHGGYYGSAMRHDALKHLINVQDTEEYPQQVLDSCYEPFFLYEKSITLGCTAYLEDLATAELKLLGISSLRITIPHLSELYFGTNPNVSKLMERSSLVLNAAKLPINHDSPNPWPHPLT